MRAIPRVAGGLCLVFAISLVAVAAAGDIQLLCEPGLRILLDGRLVGTSTAREDGLFLTGVPSGGHTIRVEKDGSMARSFQVEVGDVPIEVKVGALEPAPVAPTESEAPAAEVTQLAGSLVVTSAPQNCTVSIDGRPEEKTTPQLLIGGLPPGEHTVSFSKPGYETISTVVSLQPGVEVSVRGDLIAGRVEVAHEGKGSLRVTSKPTRCTVRILGMTREKTDRILKLSHLPAGVHRMVVSIPGRDLSTDLLIRKGHRTVVEVSFFKGDEPFVVSSVPE